MDLYFPSGSREPQIVRGTVAILATVFLLYKAYGVARAWSRSHEAYSIAIHSNFLCTYFEVINYLFRLNLLQNVV